jgi:hypothetical protein
LIQITSGHLAVDFSVLSGKPANPSALQRAGFALPPSESLTRATGWLNPAG